MLREYHRPCFWIQLQQCLSDVASYLVNYSQHYYYYYYQTRILFPNTASSGTRIFAATEIVPQFTNIHDHPDRRI